MDTGLWDSGHHEGGFVVKRAEITESGLGPFSVVEDLDVVEEAAAKKKAEEKALAAIAAKKKAEAQPWVGRSLTVENENIGNRP